MSVAVREFSRECWTEVMNRVIGAVVFLDEPSAENLHWNGGLSALLDAGAVAVKTLSPFEYATKEQKKGVFVCGCTSTQLQSMREVVRHSNFTHCVIVATASLDVVGAEIVGDTTRVGGDINPVKIIENMALEWIDKKQSAVEVVNIPMFVISPSPLIFLTPTFADLTPSFQSQLLPDNTSVDLYSLSEKERASVRRLAGCLSSMFEAMNVKEDIFYMGTFSSLVAGVLEYNPVCAARRKSCTRPASLIIVDRSLDLCAATSHTSECMLDKVLSVLPNFPGHSTDVAVDMSPLCEANMISLTDDIQLSPGCLWHDEEVCMQTFEHLMNKSQKEVLFHLHNKLSTMEVQRSPAREALRVTPATVEKVVSAAKGRYDLMESHSGLLQQALAVTQTLKSPKYRQVELLQGLEGQVLQNIATSRDDTSVLNQVSHLIKTRKDRNLSLDRLLALTVYIYSLAGHEIAFSRSHEDKLTETLSVAIFEDHRALFPDETTTVTMEGCERIAASFMSKLRDVGQIRRILTKYSSVLKPTGAGSTVEYKGVLEQLVEDLVDPERPELPDLKHRNEGIKDLLRSGFSMLMSSSSKKKHPLDNGTVLLYVVGGVTAEECRRLQRAVIASGTDANIVVGATRLLQPVWTARNVLHA